jgi:glycosyltransferase involved in cell wall biosynthesis
VPGLDERPVQVAIKIGCPSPTEKEEWGDYHFARSLSAALERVGLRSRIDFLPDWYDAAQAGDVNLVLRGLSRFEPPQDSLNLMWMISHPDKVSHAELLRYDHVFVASSLHAESLAPVLGHRVSALLQCTDPKLFRPGEAQDIVYEALFVGNSRNVYRPAVKDALEQGVALAIYGTRWRQFVPPRLIKGENIQNAALAAHYCAARVVLNDHWPDMRERGFVSNRIFDVLACGVPIVSDPVAGLPDDLRPFVYEFGGDISLKAAVSAAMNEDGARLSLRREFAYRVHERHSFDRRARDIAAVIERLTRSTQEHSDENALASA